MEDEEEKEEVESEGGRSVETRRCRRRRVRWVGSGWFAPAPHRRTDMVPSEGEDGAGWPGLCSRSIEARPVVP